MPWRNPSVVSSSSSISISSVGLPTRRPARSAPSRGAAVPPRGRHYNSRRPPRPAGLEPWSDEEHRQEPDRPPTDRGAEADDRGVAGGHPEALRIGGQGVSVKEPQGRVIGGGLAHTPPRHKKIY